MEVGGRNRRVAVHRKGASSFSSAGLDRPDMGFLTRGWHGEAGASLASFCFPDGGVSIFFFFFFFDFPPAGGQ